MPGRRLYTDRSRDTPFRRPQAWRIGLIAALVVVHAALVLSLARPVPPPRAQLMVEAVERIQLVAIEAPPPPPVVRRPQPTRADPPARPAPATASPSGAITGIGPPPLDGEPSPAEGPAVQVAPAAPPGSFIQPTTGRPLRGAARARLPGVEAPIVEGFHVRETPSIEDRVIQVSAMLFGGGRPETCDDVRQRLIGAGPGLARDMDVERLQRLCTQ